jgi:pimeloyl-ACP methyl ester carboxylesterase
MASDHQTVPGMVATSPMLLLPRCRGRGSRNRARAFILSCLLTATAAAAPGCASVPGPAGGSEVDRIRQYLADAGLSLPSEVTGKLVLRTGSADLTEVPILLFNKSPGDVRRLIVLVHGWGGSQLGTWGRLPLIFLDREASPEFGGRYDVLLFGYPSGFFASEESLIDVAERAGRTFREAASQIAKDAPEYDEVYIVAHSMGAPIAQLAIADLLRRAESPEEVKLFLRKIRGFVFVAPLNGRLKELVHGVASAFGVRQAIDAGPYGRFRTQLDSTWIIAQRSSSDEFDRLFRQNTVLVQATGDSVIDNQTVTERFANLEPLRVGGGHVSVVKVSEEGDELFRTVLRRFLLERQGNGRGLEVHPKLLSFVLNRRLCSEIWLQSLDRAGIQWGLVGNPQGYLVTPERGDLQPGARSRAMVARLYESLSAPAFEIFWTYRSGGVRRHVQVRLEERKDEATEPADTSNDACNRAADALRLFNKGEYAAAAATLPVGPEIDPWRTSPRLTKAAALSQLRAGQPQESLSWWTKYANHDKVGAVYLSGTLAGLGRREEAEAAAQAVKNPVVLTAAQYGDLRSDVPRSTLEAAGLVVVPDYGLFNWRTYLGQTRYTVSKASEHLTVVAAYSGTAILPESEVLKIVNFGRRLAATRRVQVTGYASDSSTESGNAQLARIRAEVVTRILKTSGVSASAITIVEQPVTTLPDWLVAEELTRAVTIVVLPDQEQP